MALEKLVGISGLNQLNRWADKKELKADAKRAAASAGMATISFGIIFGVMEGINQLQPILNSPDFQQHADSVLQKCPLLVIPAVIVGALLFIGTILAILGSGLAGTCGVVGTIAHGTKAALRTSYAAVLAAEDAYEYLAQKVRRKAMPPHSGLNMEI